MNVIISGEFYNNTNAEDELTAAVNYYAIVIGYFNNDEDLPAVNTTSVAIAEPKGKLFLISLVLMYTLSSCMYNYLNLNYNLYNNHHSKRYTSNNSLLY